MWFFKKKTVVEPKKLDIDFKDEMYEVGRTAVLVELVDGNQVTVLVEGEVFQSYNTSYYPPVAGAPYIINSTIRAEDFVQHIKSRALNGFFDYREINVRYYSEPKKATIAWTEKFQRSYPTAYVVDVQ